MEKKKKKIYPTSEVEIQYLSIIRHHFIRVYQSNFIRNVALVASGTTGSQLIVLLFSPVITRVYGPISIGVFGIFEALLAVLVPIATLTYSMAIILPNKDGDAKRVAILGIIIAGAVSIVVTIALIFGGDRLLDLLRARQLSKLIYLLPLAMLAEATKQIAKQWFIRKNRFSAPARAEVISALIINGSKIGFGCFYPFASVLIWISSFKSIIYAGMLSLNLKNTLAAQPAIPQSSESQTSVWDLARRFRDFPLYRAPQVFINALSRNIPTLLFAAFFGPESAGYYSICRRVLGLPSSLIGQSFGDVFYRRITDAANEGENLTRLILKSTFLLAIIGFVPFGLIFFFGPLLFGFVFGDEWITAGIYAKWMCFMMFFLLINKPCVSAVPILGLQKGLLVYELLSTGSKLVALYIGIFIFSNDIFSIAIFSIFGAIAYLVLIIWVLISSVSSRRRMFEKYETGR